MGLIEYSSLRIILKLPETSSNSFLIGRKRIRKKMLFLFFKISVKVIFTGGCVYLYDLSC
jgi:hypothetical protein